MERKQDKPPLSQPPRLNLQGKLLLQTLQQIAATVLKQFYHIFKAFLPPIIGIRHFFIRKTSREKHMGAILPAHCPFLSNRFKSRRFSRSIPTIRSNCSKSSFRTGRDLSPGSSYPYFSAPSASGYPEGSPDGNRSFRRNRSQSNVPDLVLRPFFENDFRGRRAADVAQTDKQDSVRFGSTHGRHFFFRIGRRPPHFKREEFLHGKRKRPRIWHGAEKETAPLIQK